MKTGAVVVVGSFVQDLTFHCGEFPRPGETIIGRFATGPGGKGSNQAVAAARAGGRVAFVGAIGEDGFGDGARNFLTAEGIQALLSTKTTHPTGAAGILVNSHGQNEIVVSLDANAVLSPADVEAHLETIESASVLVAQLEANLEATSCALALARRNGLITILNPAPMRPDFEASLLVNVDILIPNETEFATLAAHVPAVRSFAGDDFSAEKLNALPDEELQDVCRAFGVETIIVTLGSRGCFVSRPEGGTFIPAVKGIKVADTTGAGDAFVGAFATGLAELGREAIVAAARFANAGAALSVTRAGTAPAMPLREEIDQLLAATPA